MEIKDVRHQAYQKQSFKTDKAGAQGHEPPWEEDCQQAMESDQTMPG